MCSRYHRLLIYAEKRTTKIDSMGPFNILGYLSNTRRIVKNRNFGGELCYLQAFPEYLVAMSRVPHHHCTQIVFQVVRNQGNLTSSCRPNSGGIKEN